MDTGIGGSHSTPAHRGSHRQLHFLSFPKHPSRFPITTRLPSTLPFHVSPGTVENSHRRGYDRNTTCSTFLSAVVSSNPTTPSFCFLQLFLKPPPFASSFTRRRESIKECRRENPKLEEGTCRSIDMGYWKKKVLPRIKKVFDLKAGPKKAAAADAIKSFDETKEKIEKEFEEKKDDLKPKVLEIYEASPPEVKTVVKDRTEEGLKKNGESVNKFLEELAKIEFPGSKHACEASSKCGPNLVSPVVFFVLEKVSVCVPTEEAKVETVETPSAETSEPTKEELVVGSTEKKEEEEKKEEAKPKEDKPTSTTVEEKAEAPKPKPEGGEAKKA